MARAAAARLNAPNPIISACAVNGTSTTCSPSSTSPIALTGDPVRLTARSNPRTSQPQVAALM